MAASDKASDDSLYPIAVLIDELKNEDIQVSFIRTVRPVCIFNEYSNCIILSCAVTSEFNQEAVNYRSGSR